MDEIKPYRMQYYVTELADAAPINQAIVTAYQGLRDDPELQRSHYFAGRYENIYIPAARMPALRPVLAAARCAAADYLQQPQDGLSVGYWFNEMAPGQVTQPHCHDESDELASAVYYVRVPQDCGDLVLTRAGVETRIAAAAGRFIVFPPDLVHKVTENRSTGMRLSIGMNFGVRE